MSRAANYTIKGFLYQFNKTLVEILTSTEGSNITVEGFVEDMEIESPRGLEAIQCKYHEASESYAVSRIFKPLLQMMHHYQKNHDASISYKLFAHFPSVQEASLPTVGLDELQAALNSTNRELGEYTSALRDKINLEEFLNRFSMEFGPTYDDLVAQVNNELIKSGIPKEEIDTLAYPNAIHLIAGISVKNRIEERRITRKAFLGDLIRIRKTAISRWTMALHSRRKILAARRDQLKSYLNINARLRYLVIDSKALDDYAQEIVLFIFDYLRKYHFKRAHTETPAFCLSTSKENFSDIQRRLYKKGIVPTDGYIGGQFEEEHFFRKPFVQKLHDSQPKLEFSARLLLLEDNINVLNNRKCADLFIIGEPNCDSLNTEDVNVEYLAATSFKEVRYLLGLSDVFE